MSTRVELEGGQVQIDYHFEEGVWAASCVQLPSLFAGDPSPVEAEILARNAVAAELQPTSILHRRHQVGCVDKAGCTCFVPKPVRER